MFVSASTVSVDPRGVQEDLARALAGGERDLGAWLDATDGSRRAAAGRLRDQGRVDSYLELRLWESVAQLEAGRAERAFRTIREVWVAVEGRVPYSARALILTQLAACSKARGDLRGSIRAARRAEAFLVAEAGDSVPSVLAVRAWLLHCLEERGAGAGPVRGRLEQTLSGLAHSMATPDRQARLDRMRLVFLESGPPPHWALVHLLRWRCITAA